MSKSLFIATLEPSGGKSVVALGIMELLSRRLHNIGFFRPIIPDVESDNNIQLILNRYNLKSSHEDMYAYKHEDARRLVSHGQSDALLKNIIESAHPEVVKAATDAALAATNDVSQAQKAGLLALVASEAACRAKKEEETVSRLLAELQEQRLQKLENRMALLDDVEGILEAERVALELERRDLYTARCRHWFGGAS